MEPRRKDSKSASFRLPEIIVGDGEGSALLSREKKCSRVCARHYRRGKKGASLDDARE